MGELASGGSPPGLEEDELMLDELLLSELEPLEDEFDEELALDMELESELELDIELNELDVELEELFGSAGT